MKKLVVGILAHVDAGKTTLSEGLLYRSGCLKKLGRVDHQDAFLDTDMLEKERGITIFSKQAILPLHELEVTLLDTPGHVDFSSEMERTLQVLDYAILVISGTDGIQSHTKTLWDLLKRYCIPTFLFVNKMDLEVDKESLLRELQQRLSSSCVDFTVQGEDSFFEEIATCDESVLDFYLENGSVKGEDICSLIHQRKLFPCYFGSALKLQGVDDFLYGLEKYTLCPSYPEMFGAKVYKISRDPQGNRLTYLKVTGGNLKVKTLLSNRVDGEEEKKTDDIWEEKVDQIRLYSGAKYQTVDEVSAGTVCAVTGLKHTYPGEGIGIEPSSEEVVLEPVLTYQVILPPGYNAHDALLRLRQLEEEDPQLHIVWNEQLHEIHLQLMGEVQLEVLQRVISQRFGLNVSFGTGTIVYRETIAAPVIGVGHFEPLRHYAEVHLLLEPGKPGSGLQFFSACSEDILDLNWQRLILTNLGERRHLGVLTGSPITDMKITLLTGRAHLKHTEGGDFRQATYRAVRQGLKYAKSILLEPWYEFQLELPSEYVGRAMADLQRLSADFLPPQTIGDTTLLTGKAPVSSMQDYNKEVISYTKGRGRLFCTFKGYEPCHNQKEVIAAIGYDSERDVENTADSVFCSHGAGFVVKWDQVQDYMHLDSGYRLPEPETEEKQKSAKPNHSSKGLSSFREEDEELKAIFERTYGPIRRRNILPRQIAEKPDKEMIPPKDLGPEYLLVDGYNIIFAWDKLKKVAQDNLEFARQMLMDILSNYQGYKKCVVILVFDAYNVPRNAGEVIHYHNIHVVYTKEAETADAYIEKATYQLGKKYRVKVATSDNAEQLIILGHGALRISARSFLQEIEQTNKEITDILNQNRWKDKSYNVKVALDKAKNRKNAAPLSENSDRKTK